MTPTVSDPAVVVDVVLLLTLLGHTAAGRRLGLVGTLARTAGVVAGLLLGLRLAPEVARRWPTGPTAVPAPVVLAAVVAGAGLVVSALAALAVSRIRPPARHRVLDRIVGALTALVVAATATWLGAGAVSRAFPGDVADVVDRSRVVALLDDVAPWPRDAALDRVTDALADAGVPLLPDARHEPLTTLDDGPAVARAPGVVRASGSVVQIAASAPRCGGGLQMGSGFVAADGLVVTNAHVVTGSSSIRVLRGRLRSTARVVAFDPHRDLAVLSADTTGMPPLPLAARPPAVGAPVAVAGHPEAGPLTLQSGRMIQWTVSTRRDLGGGVARPVYAVRATVHPGNSGGPLLTRDGDVAGVVFARGAEHSTTAYVVPADELHPVLDRARTGRTVPVGSCLPR